MKILRNRIWYLLMRDRMTMLSNGANPLCLSETCCFAIVKILLRTSSDSFSSSGGGTCLSRSQNSSKFEFEKNISEKKLSAFFDESCRNRSCSVLRNILRWEQRAPSKMRTYLKKSIYICNFNTRISDPTACVVGISILFSISEGYEHLRDFLSFPENKICKYLVI